MRLTNTSQGNGLRRPHAPVTPLRIVAIVVGTIVAVLLVCAVYKGLQTWRSTTHLQDHVLLGFESSTMSPTQSVIFHTNGMGLYHRFPTPESLAKSHADIDGEDAAEDAAEGAADKPRDNWFPCRYTWHPARKQLQIRYLTGPLATDTATVRFTETVQLPQEGLEGHAAFRDMDELYLWKVAHRSRPPALLGKTIRFSSPHTGQRTQLPFDQLHLVSTTQARCSRRSDPDATGTYKAVYRHALPTTSKWTSAVYLQGRPDASGEQPRWKSATLRLCSHQRVAELQWRDAANVHRKVSNLPFVVERD